MSTANIQQLLSDNLPQAQQLLDQLMAVKANHDTPPKVVVYGVYNSGKSSLLNCLTGHVVEEYFPTRDIPETKYSKTLDYQGVCYIDTPGLDIDEADTAQANTRANQADILLFVHKLTAGPIQAEQMHTMQQLLSSHGKPSQVLAVITGVETAEHQRDLIDDIQAQLKQLLPSCKPFPVSNMRFIKGVREGVQPLIHHSGIPQLLEALNEQVAKITQNLAQQREAKQQHLKQQLQDVITDRKEDLELLIELEEAKEQRHISGFVDEVLHLQMLVMESEIENMLGRLG